MRRVWSSLGSDATIEPPSTRSTYNHVEEWYGCANRPWSRIGTVLVNIMMAIFTPCVVPFRRCGRHGDCMIHDEIVQDRYNTAWILLVIRVENAVHVARFSMRSVRWVDFCEIVVGCGLLCSPQRFYWVVFCQFDENWFECCWVLRTCCNPSAGRRHSRLSYSFVSVCNPFMIDWLSR